MAVVLPQDVVPAAILGGAFFAAPANWGPGKCGYNGGFVTTAARRELPCLKNGVNVYGRCAAPTHQPCGRGPAVVGAQGAYNGGPPVGYGAIGGPPNGGYVLFGGTNPAAPPDRTGNAPGIRRLRAARAGAPLWETLEAATILLFQQTMSARVEAVGAAAGSALAVDEASIIGAFNAANAVSNGMGAPLMVLPPLHGQFGPRQGGAAVVAPAPVPVPASRIQDAVHGIEEKSYLRRMEGYLACAYAVVSQERV
ncbi:uncharacterized protein LY89DRAFT_666398 [Mollisia scopiformis]|uniref:Uncharacterized protein n=1 Tax=Mollisia scopiformis TaxID=149040 RepID=A0A194XLX0_MOLSC|nr:uncharacterized protein LY89DRAFT_666398 [Mollisia scopiformis]KUJ20762.1 hypothetical protein LY89DRAFT_666398 [Mollisia scopiformis]